MSYEVRLRAWNCSCPAFTFAAFKNLGLDADSSPIQDSTIDQSAKPQGWMFGGDFTQRIGGAPVCKHLLACLLGSMCPRLFGGGIADKVVGVKEAARWGAE